MPRSDSLLLWGNMDNTPRPYVRIDRVWFLDRKYRRVSHQAILLHFGLIGLSSHEATDGKVRREDADVIGDTIRINAGEAWDCLVEHGLLVPLEGEWFQLPNYNRWQVLSADRARAASHGAAGGKKSAARREASPVGLAPLPRPPKPDVSQDDSDFDFNEGLNEALALYPFTKYQDSRQKQEQGYRATVADADDHARVMLAIANYREYQEYVKKTEGVQRSAEMTAAFSNFLTSDKWQGYMTSKVPTDEALAAAPTIAPSTGVSTFASGNKGPRKKPDPKPSATLEDFDFLDEQKKA